MGDLGYRLSLMFLNVFFPPLSILIMCGADMTFVVNVLLWLCAIIPSHVHGFYVSCVYFHRRRKVRKGRYPGGPKALIYSDHVLNGGANQTLVDRLYWAEKGDSRRRSSSRSRSRSTKHRGNSARSEVQRSNVNRQLNHERRRPRSVSRSSYDRSDHTQYLSKDGYGTIR
ncbi:unnamed protein product [Cercospora beticola]|nr:unnamed protein product [Cercospora beticola]